jgi:hypothetical protein
MYGDFSKTVRLAGDAAGKFCTSLPLRSTGIIKHCDQVAAYQFLQLTNLPSYQLSVSPIHDRTSSQPHDLTISRSHDLTSSPFHLSRYSPCLFSASSSACIQNLQISPFSKLNGSTATPSLQSLFVFAPTNEMHRRNSWTHIWACVNIDTPGLSIFPNGERSEVPLCFLFVNCSKQWKFF